MNDNRLLGLLLLFLISPLMPACSSSVGAAGGEPEPRERLLVVAVAAPGRVEGATEVVELGTAMDGLIFQIQVREGEAVEAGQTLVLLACEERIASLRQAEAELRAMRGQRQRLVRGSRDEQRRAAAAATDSARAVLHQTRSRHGRLSALAETSAIVSRDDLDAARRDLRVAEAALSRAVEDERLTNSELLPEERARADASVDSADQRRRLALARVDRCRIAAPMSGTVLRVHRRPGEQVSLALPRPIVSLADTSVMRVRAEVDESDVGRIRPGQRTWIGAEALGADRLPGFVTRIEPLMGRRTVLSRDPAEKSDRDVQEVLVELDAVDPRLVIGLRVTALFRDDPRDSS